jgi:cysteine dioxygenase
MGQNCWMAILDGRIEEVQYHQQPGGRPGPLIEKGARVCGRGQVAYISDDIALHLVRPERGTSGVSLHLYSRPYDTCHIYDPTTGIASEQVLAYHSIHGERCADQGTILSSRAHGSSCL